MKFERCERLAALLSTRVRRQLGIKIEVLLSYDNILRVTVFDPKYEEALTAYLATFWARVTANYSDLIDDPAIFIWFKFKERTV